MTFSGIADGGFLRLRKAIKSEIRKKYQPDLDTAPDKQAKAAIEEKMKSEIKARIKEYDSPYSLWNAAL